MSSASPSLRKVEPERAVRQKSHKAPKMRVKEVPSVLDVMAACEKELLRALVYMKGVCNDGQDPGDEGEFDYMDGIISVQCKLIRRFKRDDTEMRAACKKLGAMEWRDPDDFSAEIELFKKRYPERWRKAAREMF